MVSTAAAHDALGATPDGGFHDEPRPHPAPAASFSSRLQLSERRAFLLFGELSISVIALIVATLPRGWWHLPGNAPVSWWFVSLLLLDIVVAQASDADHLGRAANAFSGSYASVRAWLATAIAYLALPYISAPLLQSRGAVVIFVATGLLLRVGWRSAYALLVRQPIFITRFLIVGSGSAAAMIAVAIRSNLGPEYHVIGCVREDMRTDSLATDAGQDERSLPILGGPDQLDGLLQSGDVSTLILATVGALPAALYSSVMRAYEAGIRVVPMPVFYEAVTGRVPVEHVGNYWYVSLPKMEQDWLYLFAKRIVDIAGAAVGLSATLVLFPFVALAIKLSSPGPVFFSQTRSGLRGTPFTVWKFRTMSRSAEGDGVPRWAQAGDRRITGVGRLLRKSHIDELPQFWNVLRGEMSLVGPRPERPEFVERLQDQVPFYRVRLLVRPGITGWAQVKQFHAGSVEDTLLKLQYDLYYISHRSLYLDLLIMLKTVAVSLRFRGT